MESEKFDALVARLSTHVTRRRSLGALGALGIAGASLASEAEAKKKKKKKKKKKGDSGGTTTTLAPPSCPGGQRLCHGSCISVDACCVTSECAAGQMCTRGFCACPGNAIACGDRCCDKASEICEIDAGVTSCRAGTCPATSYCAAGGPGNPDYLCANSTSGFCVCTNTVDPTPERACINIAAVTSCGAVCANSDQCPSDSVCIGTGENCNCAGNFCVPRCPVSTTTTTTTTPPPVCAGGVGATCGASCGCAASPGNPGQVRCVSPQNPGGSCTQDSECSGGRVCVVNPLSTSQNVCALSCSS
jgi:hypothetical protein